MALPLRPILRSFVLGLGLASGACAVLADEGGVSFWLPGQMGSFSAAPGEAGFTLPLMYYHTSVSADASKAFPLGGRITAGISARGDLAFAFPTYVFPGRTAGAQASVGLGVGGGRMNVKVDATLTGPRGATVSGQERDSLWGTTDLYPTATFKWNEGVNNFMTYALVGVPVGSYRAGRLANLGTGHWSLDVGGGYTYLDPREGNEFTVVSGLTYNFKNEDTEYKNGVDLHVDWAASKIIASQFQVGLAGYFYQQVSGDSGSGARLGDFKSRVYGIGPQVGYFFKVGDRKWYANVKTIWEFNAANRPPGWNVMLSVAIPLTRS